MIPVIGSNWILIGAAALACMVSGVAGYKLADTLADARVAQIEERRMECEHARAADARAAADKAAALLARAQDAEAQAAHQIAQQQQTFDKRLKEVRSEISKLATGRECLSGPLRLRINSAIAAADPVSEGAGHADAAHAAAADDTAVADWITDAVRLYDDCRSRIDAIRRWDEVTYGR